MINIAVVSFPGTNNEIETLRAVKTAGMEGEIVRWNEDAEKISGFDGYVLPGGFSYEDRGRAGVIAAGDSILEILKEENKERRKPILGICNGAQILVESGLIPGLSGRLDMALAKNERVLKKEVLGTGFYNSWVYIKPVSPFGRSIGNSFVKTIHIPVAHGEGRFVSEDRKVLETLHKNNQIVFKYCDKKGKIKNIFPINPNGSMENIAGICNVEGDILAMMPHPERCESGLLVFFSMKKWIEKNKNVRLKTKRQKSRKPQKYVKLGKREKLGIELFVKQIITDNEEKTVEKVIRKKGFPGLELKRFLYWGIESGGKQLRKIAENLIKSGEFINANKEFLYIRFGNKYFKYTKEKRFIQCKNPLREGVIAFDKKDIIAKKKLNGINNYIKAGKIKNIKRGVFWEINGIKKNELTRLISTDIFANPHSMELVKS